MKAPRGISLEDLGAVLTQAIAERYLEDEFGGLRCRGCDLPVRWATWHFSVHNLGCAGPGIVTTRPLPYCLVCEGEPAERDVYGCVHVHWKPRTDFAISSGGAA